MSKLSRRETAMAAELLADRLLDVYQNEQVAEMVSQFAAAGFSRSALVNEADALFRMIVIAAYDRRPFTQAAGGYETIWEIDGRSRGVPSQLSSAGLWSIREVLQTSPQATDRKLAGLSLGQQTMANDGRYTQFARTLKDSARLVHGGLLADLHQAETPQQVAQIFGHLTTIHGIGDTIAAKLIMYTLREIGIGRATPDIFPLNVTWPLTQEWHASGAIGQLYSLGPTLVPLAAGVLHQRGDGFAIDALFYLHRNRPDQLRTLVDALQGARTGTPAAPRATPAKAKDGEATCAALLAIIKDVCDDALDLTADELRAQGIQMTVDKIMDSNRYLYRQMEKKASEGKPSLMVQYYERCLRSRTGQMYDRILQKLGRKCLASEKERFMRVAQGADDS